MLDFLEIDKKELKNGTTDIFPRFIVTAKSNDLMIRGKDFYAVWNPAKRMWSTDEQDVIDQVDDELRKYAEKYAKLEPDRYLNIRYMYDSDSGSIDKWHKYCQSQMRERFKPLDEKIIFSNTEISKRDYASKRLNYPLEEGDISAYEELISTLYDPSEREKLEWAIGAIISGDSKKIQKFVVLYGSAGSGKSTVLNIIQNLFDGYYSLFDSRELASSNNSFALESFKSNPLVSIQHDGDLSRIEDNTKLNSIVSHETMEINEKFKAKYTAKFNTFLFMGTNKPVRITEAKSGIIRRLIDVHPSGRKIPFKRYQELMKKIVGEELSGIAYYCLDIYNELGESYYDTYVPREMMAETNDFYDFIEFEIDRFKSKDYVTLNEAWKLYKEYCDFANVQFPFNMRIFRAELKNYFRKFEDRANIDGKRVRNVYSSFIMERFMPVELQPSPKEVAASWLQMSSDYISEFDVAAANYPAQYANENGTPLVPWNENVHTLKELKTNELHYVKVPENHIVIDFDIRDEDGKKNFEANYSEALKWPPTYAEVSKSGNGIHLHYIYEGDVKQLSRVYDDFIEVKVFTGNSSLRRKLTLCNSLKIAVITAASGLLPLKGGAKMVNWDGVKSEKMLRSMILKNLDKGYHDATKPSVDYIYKLLDDAYKSGMHYDVSDLQQSVFTFAMNSTNQSKTCVKLVGEMKFKSDDPSENVDAYEKDYDRLIFFDIEVFPNLLLVNWKFAGANSCVRMINPSSNDIEELVKYKLIGFNCRRYDNHILYARMMGYKIEEIYNVSQRIISGDRAAMFGEAYNLSYTDVYDFLSKKQSLKKWEIELGIHHQELGLPWDEPVPEEKWTLVAEYCDNDVIATEAVFNARKQDFVAREILADLSGLTVNDTTRMHATKIIFGNDKKPQLVYTDLSKTFPGYEFKDNKNLYFGEDASFGGYVYSEPGMYTNVALLDVASLHPSSIIAMNVFGDYTPRFKDILDARIAIKHHDLDKAKNMLDGKLAKYLGSDEEADQLAQALKIVINSVYGYTSATFDNPFRDPRNVNNIVALRGALFMMSLKHEVQKRGFTVAHIKTDSIKIPNATKEIIDFCMEYAKKYQYTFEHEATYEKMCLVNDAVYIAKYSTPESCNSMYGYSPKEVSKHPGEWTATGTQFQVPYVFKTLFSKEPIVFADLCETKSVSAGDIYLDMNEGYPDVSEYEKREEKLAKELKVTPAKLNEFLEEVKELAPEQYEKHQYNLEQIAKGHNYIFVGRVGQFCPIKKGCGGGVLYRKKDGKYFAITGTKGYRWLESERVSFMENGEENIDRNYYKELADQAIVDISAYGDFDWFVSTDPVPPVSNMPDFMNVPITENEEVPFEDSYVVDKKGD